MALIMRQVPGTKVARCKYLQVNPIIFKSSQPSLIYGLHQNAGVSNMDGHYEISDGIKAVTAILQHSYAGLQKIVQNGCIR
jgi:hypothetical protein